MGDNERRKGSSPLQYSPLEHTGHSRDSLRIVWCSGIVPLCNLVTPLERLRVCGVAWCVQQEMTDSVATIKVLFFASAREAAGDISFADVELPATNATTTTLRRKLAEIYPDLESMVMDEDNITLALNEEYVIAGQDLSLKSGDTVALIPPISGG